MRSEADRQALTYLAAVPGIGPAFLRKLQQWAQSKSLSLAEIAVNPGKVPYLAQNQLIASGIRELGQRYSVGSYSQWLAEQAIGVLFPDDAEYSMLLRQAAVTPMPLYYRGDQRLLLAEIPIAVVGSRRTTVYGERATKSIVRQLSYGGATIVSGFMYGIDTLAHQEAIKAGGATIAVLGFGFGQMFPASHQRLFEYFLQRGALFVSQFAPGTPPTANNFPARNKVVAGLSRAVVVTEAARKSGSLITAGAAVDEGRAVCVISGPFDSPYTQGTKWLINQGAKLVTSAADIFDEIGVTYFAKTSASTSASPARLNEFEKQLVAQIHAGVHQTDELMEQLAVSAEQIAITLTDLELAGVLSRTARGWTVC